MCLALSHQEAHPHLEVIRRRHRAQFPLQASSYSGRTGRQGLPFDASLPWTSPHWKGEDLDAHFLFHSCKHTFRSQKGPVRPETAPGGKGACVASPPSPKRLDQPSGLAGLALSTSTTPSTYCFRRILVLKPTERRGSWALQPPSWRQQELSSQDSWKAQHFEYCKLYYQIIKTEAVVGTCEFATTWSEVQTSLRSAAKSGAVLRGTGPKPVRPANNSRRRVPGLKYSPATGGGSAAIMSSL